MEFRIEYRILLFVRFSAKCGRFWYIQKWLLKVYVGDA